MAGTLCLIAWGLWCLLRAPVLAARYQRDLDDRHDFPDLKLVSPREWRLMGSAWLAVGLLGFLSSWGY